MEIFARTLSLQQAASIIDSVPDADSDNTLAALIAHCLRKEPSERPESIDNVAEKLRLIGSE